MPRTNDLKVPTEFQNRFKTSPGNLRSRSITASEQKGNLRTIPNKPQNKFEAPPVKPPAKPKPIKASRLDSNPRTAPSILQNKFQTAPVKQKPKPNPLTTGKAKIDAEFERIHAINNAEYFRYLKAERKKREDEIARMCASSSDDELDGNPKEEVVVRYDFAAANALNQTVEIAAEDEVAHSSSDDESDKNPKEEVVVHCDSAAANALDQTVATAAAANEKISTASPPLPNRSLLTASVNTTAILNALTCPSATTELQDEKQPPTRRLCQLLEDADTSEVIHREDLPNASFYQPLMTTSVARVTSTAVDHKSTLEEFKNERIARRSSVLGPRNAGAVTLKPAPVGGAELLQNLFDMSGLAMEDFSIEQLLGFINFDRRSFSPEYNEWVALDEKSAKFKENLDSSNREKITVPYDGGKKSHTFKRPNFPVLTHTTPIVNALEILKDKGTSLLDCWKICLGLLQDGLHGYTACHGIPSVALVLRFKAKALLDVQPRDVNTPSHFARAKGLLSQSDSEKAVINYIKLQLQYLEFAYKLQKMFFEARKILRLYPIRLKLYQIHYELLDLSGAHARENHVLNDILDLMRSGKLGELGIAGIREIFKKIKEYFDSLKAPNAQNGKQADRFNAKMAEAAKLFGQKAVDDAMQAKKSIGTKLAEAFKIRKSKKQKAQATEDTFIKALKSYIFKDIQWAANDKTLDQVFARILQELEAVFAMKEIPIPDFSPDKQGQAPIARYIEETIKIVKMMVDIKPAGSCKNGELDELEKWVFRTILELEPNNKSVFEMLDEMLKWTVKFCENYKRDVRKAGDEGDVTQFRAPMSPTEAIARTKLWMEINALGSKFFELELVGVAVESALIQEGMSAEMAKCFELAEENNLEKVWIQSGPIAEKLGFFLYKFLITSISDEIVQIYKDKRAPINRPLGLIIEYLKQAPPQDGLDIRLVDDQKENAGAVVANKGTTAGVTVPNQSVTVSIAAAGGSPIVHRASLSDPNVGTLPHNDAAGRSRSASAPPVGQVVQHVGSHVTVLTR